MRPKKFIEQRLLFLAASLTLGLAPFTPEPHIWGKIKWIMGGAKDMQLIDWWDTIMHGTPWVLLIASWVYWMNKKFTPRQTIP